MNATERNELGELDHGTIARNLGADSVKPIGGATVTIDGIEVPEGWELLIAGEVRKVRANSEFLAHGTRYPAWKIEDESGGIRLAFEVKLFAPPTLCSARNEARAFSDPCGMAWMESTGPLLIRTSKA